MLSHVPHFTQQGVLGDSQVAGSSVDVKKGTFDLPRTSQLDFEAKLDSESNSESSALFKADHNDQEIQCDYSHFNMYPYSDGRKEGRQIRSPVTLTFWNCTPTCVFR